MSDIVGIGNEIVECVRIAKLIERYGETFLRRVYTPSEITYCSAKAFSTQHYTAHWAAKEAILKALGVKLSADITMRDIELSTSLPDNAVKVGLGGRLRELTSKRRICELKISTSYCRNYASAFVIAIAEQT